jgi:hypothetical protein
MLILGHEHSDFHEEHDSLADHEAVIEHFFERKKGELGVNETITPHILRELRRQSIEEAGKAIGTGAKGGKGSRTKQSVIKSRQASPRFRSSQRQHAREASKRLDKEVQKLQDHLQKQVKLYQAGEISFNRLETRASIAFKETVEAIFKLGVRAVGLVTPTGAAYNLTQAEKKWISSYLKEELGYFKKFLAQIKANKSRRDVERRTSLYANAMRSVYEAGRVLSVGPDVLIYWVLESANPCPDCVLLNKHNPYTVDTLPTTPKAGQTRCRANCYCSLRIDTASPNAVKKVRAKQKKPSWLLKKIRDQQKKKV